MADDRTIFVISDLHIGDGGSRDNFGHKDSDRPEQLMAFLDYVASENGELLIIGDLFEFWQASFSKVITHNLPLLDRLAELDTTYVLGNHDADLKEFIGRDLLAHPLFKTMTLPLPRDIGGRTFKFMHGHEIDDFNKKDAPGWGRMMAIFAGICEDKVGSPMLGNTPLESLMTRIGEWLLKCVANGFTKVKASKTKSAKKELTPTQNLDRATQMLAQYAADREAEGYDVAIVGHTHQPGRIGDWYYNTGSWATSDNNFVQITPAGDVQVYDWNNGNPKPNDAVLSLPETPKPTEALPAGGDVE